jgi:hypothetical protein
MPRALLLAVLAALAAGGGGVSASQRDTRGSGRKVTTVDALLNYPVFFHTQNVAVRGRLQTEETGIWLVSGEQRVLATGPGTTGSGTSGTIEARGTFFDVGRLPPEDPRYTTNRFPELTQERLGRDRPSAGELLVLVVSSSVPATPPPAPTIRTIVLEPERYTGQVVTVTGRFRGRNLFGDLPEAPSVDRWQFIVQSADAALWVIGRRPRGRGFELDPNARVDTNKWVEVTGHVNETRGIVVLVANRIELVKEPETTDPNEAPPPPPPQRIEPTVLFSAPTAEETDVPPTTRVRIQFSRDMDASTFRKHVVARYEGNTEGLAPLDPAVTYNEGTRVLELKFAQPLVPLQQVKIELLDGIISRGDKVPLKPWSLTFTVGAP